MPPSRTSRRAPRSTPWRRSSRVASSGEGARLLGPAPLFRLRGRERQVLVVKAPARRLAVQGVGEAVRRVTATRKHPEVSFSVDVDPQ